MTIIDGSDIRASDSARTSAGSRATVRERPGRPRCAVAPGRRSRPRRRGPGPIAAESRRRRCAAAVCIERAAFVFPSVQVAVIARTLCPKTLRPAHRHHPGRRAERADSKQCANQTRPVPQHVAPSQSRRVYAGERPDRGRRHRLAVRVRRCAGPLHRRFTQAFRVPQQDSCPDRADVISTRTSATVHASRPHPWQAFVHCPVTRGGG
jgi:hypothetical protein